MIISTYIYYDQQIVCNKLQRSQPTPFKQKSTENYNVYNNCFKD